MSEIITDIRDALDKATDASDNLKDQLEVLRTLFEDLESELEDLKNDLRDANQEIEELRIEHQFIYLEFPNHISSEGCRDAIQQAIDKIGVSALRDIIEKI